MVRFFAALLFVAVAISTSAGQIPSADTNHQEQNFETCGHRLSQAQCDIYANDALGTSANAATESEAAKPLGCYKDTAGPTYHFNTNVAAVDVKCTANEVCICDKLVGAFDTSSVACNSLGFDPTFTYNPGSQTQDVTVDIQIGTAVTGSTDPDDQCKSSKTTTDGTKTTTLKADFHADFIAQIPFGTVAAPKCGGTLDHITDTTDGKKKIQYKVNAEATVTRNFRSTVQRKRKFIFSLECLMERAITATSDQSWTVAAALIEANEVDAAKNTFVFTATLKFYEDDTYAKAETSALTPNNNAKVYAQIEKGANQALFIYSVEKCYATIAEVPTVTLKDTFFEAQCPLDETMDFHVDGTSKNFRFDIQAFSFTTGTQATDAVFLHCDIKVCLDDAAGDNTLAPDCVQKGQSECTTPINNNRRRRDVSYKSLSNGGYREETISSSQPILLEGSQFHAPQCGDGFVYDRVAKECSRNNLIEVKGIRLASDVFKADFYNTSSKAFKDMAKEKEYLLWVLVMATGQDKTIRGVQVIGAQPGSVILDVVVKYADTVTPEQAFTTFKQLLKAPASTTRVQNVLQITQKKTIEYVPVVRQGEKADTEKLILIVVVVVLFVVVFIAGVTLFKVKQVRQQASNARPAAGFENKGVDA